jgi:hypothetical protein
MPWAWPDRDHPLRPGGPPGAAAGHPAGHRAASTIREPTITTIPFRPVSTSATPTGSTDGPNDVQGGLDDRKRAGACRRHDSIIEPDQEHQHEAEKIKMGVGRRQGEILAHPHDDPEYESAR